MHPVSETTTSHQIIKTGHNTPPKSGHGALPSSVVDPGPNFYSDPDHDEFLCLDPDPEEFFFIEIRVRELFFFVLVTHIMTLKKNNIRIQVQL